MQHLVRENFEKKEVDEKLQKLGSRTNNARTVIEASARLGYYYVGPGNYIPPNIALKRESKY